jgi:peptidoglycan/xylan/chitin deacetylase (PgdA/CDA1 family)
MHTVTIQGNNAATTMVSSKTVRVFVSNQPSGTAARVDPKAYFEAWHQLWNVMRLKPSVCAINYEIAVCAMNLNKPDRAQEALESVIAINPGFRDAKTRLIKLRGGGRDDVKVYKSRAGLNRVALTFDDGPTPSVTGALDILRHNGIHGTFFVVGKQVETFPDLLKSIHKDGNEIQNHTFNHLALSYLKEEDIEREYFSTSCAVRNVTGVGTTCVRPPGGRSGAEYFRFLRQYGVLSILWTVNCVSREGTNKSKLVSYVLDQIRPGTIILMHYGDMVVQQALPEIIAGLKARRYDFVTVSELINQ